MRRVYLIIYLFFFITHPVFAADKITVLLDWFLNPDHAPLFVAEQQGFFRQQNLEVKLISPAESADPPKLIAAGQGDIALDYQPQFLQQVNRGLPLSVIGVLIDKPLNCLAVLQDSGIHTIKDLKGKIIGHTTGEISGVMSQTMLKKNGLSPNDVKWLNVHYDLSQALLTHQVDAVTGLTRTFEPVQMALAHHPVLLFYPEDNGVPLYSELIFVVNKNKKNDARFTRFLIAVKQGETYLAAHPEEMWLAFAKVHPELNDELNKRAWFSTLPYFSKNPTYIDPKQWQDFYNFMQQNHLL